MLRKNLSEEADLLSQSGLHDIAARAERFVNFLFCLIVFNLFKTATLVPILLWRAAMR